MKQNIALLNRPRRLKQLLMTVMLMIYLRKSIVRLYQTYKNLSEKVKVGLLIEL